MWPEVVALQVEPARWTGGRDGALSAPRGPHLVEEKGVSPGVARSSSPGAVCASDVGPSLMFSQPSEGESKGSSCF